MEDAFAYVLTLDLKHPRSKDILRRLCQWADVLCENFRPDVLGRLGLSYEVAKDPGLTPLADELGLPPFTRLYVTCVR